MISILIQCENETWVKELKYLVDSWKGCKYLGKLEGIKFVVDGIDKPIDFNNKEDGTTRAN